jgi:hypothetical protein
MEFRFANFVHARNYSCNKTGETYRVDVTLIYLLLYIIRQNEFVTIETWYEIIYLKILGMSNRLKPYKRLLGQVSDRVPGYSVENLFCSV